MYYESIRQLSLQKKITSMVWMVACRKPEVDGVTASSLSNVRAYFVSWFITVQTLKETHSSGEKITSKDMQHEKMHDSTLHTYSASVHTIRGKYPFDSKNHTIHIIPIIQSGITIIDCIIIEDVYSDLVSLEM